MIVPLRVKKDVLKDLPDKLEEVRYVQMGKEQQKLFCCDLSLCFDGYKGESAKREAVMDLIHTLIDEGHRALLFSQFTSMLALIREEFIREKIPFYGITGATRKE